MCIDFPSGPQGRERKTRRSCLVNLSTLRPSQSGFFVEEKKKRPHLLRPWFIDWTHAQGEHGGHAGKEFTSVIQSTTFMLESS